MKRILIIDDNETNLLVIKSIVKKYCHNCEVSTCISGLEGLKKIKKINPDVILLDIVMPDIDGYEVCRILKSNVKTVHIPVILITAYKTDVDSRIKGFEVGADAFLTKPIEPTELQAQLKAMIRIREMEDALKIRNSKLEDLLISQTEKIWKEEKKYKKLVETIEEGVVNIDIHGNFTYVNQAAAIILGYPASELINRNFKDLVVTENIDTFNQELKKRQLGISSKYELQIIRKNNEKRIIKLSTTPEFNNENMLIGTVAIFFDITQQVKSVNQLKKQYELTKLVSETSDIDEMSEMILNYLVNFKDIDCGGVYLLNKDGSLSLYKSAGLKKEFIDSASYFEANSPQTKLIMKGELIIKDYSQLCIDEVDAKNEARKEAGLKAIGIIPILYKNNVVAVINIGAFACKKFSEYTETVLKYLPSQFGSAFARAIAEKELKLSEDKFRNLVENTTIAISQSNLTGDITYVNDAAIKLSGYSSSEEITKNNSIFVYKNPSDRLKFIAELKKNGKSVNFETQFLNSKNETKSMILNASLTGNILTTMMIDITEKKKIEKELIKFKTISDKANYGTFIYNSEGIILYANKFFAEMHNYTVDEFVGKNILKLHNEKQLPMVLETNKDLVAREYYKNKEIWHTRKDGTVFPTLMNGMTIYDEETNTKYFSATAIDITEIKQYEKKLELALKKSKKAEKLKSSFLATMSHELRTPLTAIIGFSDIINNEMEMEDILQLNQMINSSGLHLNKIIDDIFQLSLLESDEVIIKTENIKLNDILSKIKISLNNKTKTLDYKDILLRYIPNKSNTNPVINTDGEKLHQIIMNIFDNAFKFSNEFVNIKYGYNTIIKHNIPYVQFFIEDNGIGIDNDFFDFIFEKFRQVEESHTRKYEGAGIGLTISKQLAELLGGNIWLKSKLGKGSTFYLEFPMKNTEKTVISETLKPSKQDSSILVGKTILVVEDEISNYFLVELILKKRAVNIIRAKNGKEAYDYIVSGQKADIIIMDIRMPEMNGYETTKKIKAIKKDLPIIAYTAYALDGDEDMALDAGCDAYLKKPAKSQELIQIIEKYLIMAL